MSTKFFTPETHSWWWFENNAAEPSVQLANEVTAPTLADESIIRLRWCVNETGGLDPPSGPLFRIQVEDTTDNPGAWNTLGAGQAFNWANGLGTEGNAITAVITTAGATVLGFYQESDALAQTPLAKNNHIEWDAAIVPVNGNYTGGNTYTFRLQIDSGAGYVTVGASAALPSLVVTSIITVIVDTDGVSGDYASLAAFQAGFTPKDLDANNIKLTVECQASGGAADTALCGLTGWTTSEINDLTIRQADSDRHNGTWDITKYRMEYTATGGVQYCLGILGVNNCTIDRIPGKITNSAYDNCAVFYISAVLPSTAISLIENCIARGVISGTAGATRQIGIWTNSPGISTVRNNLIYDIDGAGTNCYGIFIGHTVSTVDATIDNNTIYNVDYGVLTNGSLGTRLLRNNIVRDSSNNAYDGTFHASSDFNSADDATATALNATKTSGSPWNSSAIHDDAIFLDVGNNDYRLNPDGAWVTAWDADDINGGAWVDHAVLYNNRVAVWASDLVYLGSKIKITLAAGIASENPISAVSFGPKQAASDPFDFDSAPTQVTFDSSVPVTVAIGVDEVSDEISYDFDPAIDHLFHVVNAGNHVYQGGYTDGMWRKTGAGYNDSMVEDVTGYSITSYLVDLQTIEVYQANSFINVGDDLSSSFTYDAVGTTRPTGADTWDLGFFEYVVSGDYMIVNATATVIASVTPSSLALKAIISSVIASTTAPTSVLVQFVTPTAATCIASTTDPTTFIEIFVTPTATSAITTTDIPDLALNAEYASAIASAEFPDLAFLAVASFSIVSTTDPTVCITKVSTVVSVITSSTDPTLSYDIINAAVSTIASVTDPSVAGDEIITPTAASAIASTTDLTVTVDTYITSVAASTIASSISPSLALIPVIISAIASTVDPVSERAMTLTLVSAIVSVTDPTLTYDTYITPSAVSVIVSTDSPDMAIRPVQTSVIASTTDPTVFIQTYITSAVASTIASTKDSDKAFIPRAASAIASVNNPQTGFDIFETPVAVSTMVSTTDPSIAMTTVVVSVIAFTTDPSVSIETIITPSVASTMASTDSPSLMLVLPTASTVASATDPDVGNDINIVPSIASAIVSTSTDVTIMAVPVVASTIASAADPFTFKTPLLVTPAPAFVIVSTFATGMGRTPSIASAIASTSVISWFRWPGTRVKKRLKTQGLRQGKKTGF